MHAVGKNLPAPVENVFPSYLSAMVKMIVVMEVMKETVFHLVVAHMSFSAIVLNVFPRVGYVIPMLTAMTSLMNRLNTVVISPFPL